MDIENGARNIKLTIAYDGTAYHGFQRQENALGIQQVIEERLETIFGHPIRMSGAGRTDTGVHAYGQVVNFHTTGTIGVERISRAAEGRLPPDIIVLKAEEAPERFHARISAKSKIYLYRIHQGAVPDPFLRNYAWHKRNVLDVTAMHKAMQLIVGTHDFSAFRGANGQLVDPVRTILKATCRQEGEIIEFTFWGTGFIYHMVRNLVGTLVDIGSGKRSEEDFRRILASRNRKLAGITAPPQGLYLKEVLY